MRLRSIAVAGILFVTGFAVGAAQKAAPSLYRDKSNPEAAQALLEVAKKHADDGSWERIAIGRVYYLSGSKVAGQAIFDDVLGSRPEPSDIFRIARVYREAGDWSRAKVLFDRYLRENPDEAQETAQIGAYYQLHGDRAGAEELFDRSFKLEPKDLWSTVAAAGSYLGVAPQE